MTPKDIRRACELLKQVDDLREFRQHLRDAFGADVTRVSVMVNVYHPSGKMSQHSMDVEEPQDIADLFDVLDMSYKRRDDLMEIELKILGVHD